MTTTGGYDCRNDAGVPRRISPSARHGRQRLPTQIKAWREFRGYSQEELAEIVGSSKASVSRIENGSQPYGQDFLEMVAEALKTEPHHLLASAPHKHKRKHVPEP